MNVSRVVSGCRRLRGLWVALALVAALGAPFAAAEAAEPSAYGAEVVLAGDGAEIEAGTVLVLPEDGVAACVSVAAKVASDERTDGMDVEERLIKVDLSEGADVDEAVSDFGRIAGVAIAQPNYVYRLDDASAGSLTAANGAGGLSLPTEPEPYGPEQDAFLESIGAFDAWRLLDEAGIADRCVSVAVLDTGCDLTHEDLQDGAVRAFNDVIYNNDSDPDAFMEGDHGTHVAGVIAATEGNGRGVRGVGHNKVAAVPVQIFFESGYTTSYRTNQGLSWVIDHAQDYGIRVANMSLGSLQDAVDKYDRLVMDAVERASENGILSVCAAGNVGTDRTYWMCDYIDGIGVISLTDASDPPYTERASNSNYNAEGKRTKQLSAPGRNIYSTVVGGYGYMSGTSMASPVVAAAAALVCAADPSIEPAEVRDLLVSTATDLYGPGFDVDSGYGRVDAAAAVEAALAGKRGIATADVSFSGPAEYSLDGVEPEPTVVLHGVTLERGRDYTLSWSGNDALGTGVVSVEGAGRYVGSVSGEFEIAPRDIARAQLELGSTSVIYTGETVAPQVMVRDGDVVLAEGVDYRVSCEDGVECGTATLVVEGIGNYTGTTSRAYEIVEGGFTNVAGDPASTVYWKLDYETLRIRATDAEGEGYEEVGVVQPTWGDIDKENVTKVVVEGGLKPTSMRDWFRGFTALSEIEGIENIDTSRCESFAGTFRNCSSLVAIDLSTFAADSARTNAWDTGGVSYLFYGCSKLASVEMPRHKDLGSKLLYGWRTFDGCSSLERLELTHVNLARALNLEIPGNLTILSLEGSVLRNSDVSAISKSRATLRELDLSGASPYGDVSWEEAFAHCSKLERIDLPGEMSGSLRCAFANCTGLEQVDLSGTDLSGVTSLKQAFRGSGLVSVDLSGKDLSRVADMEWAFSGCPSLGSLDLHGARLDSAESLSQLAVNCGSLETLDLSGLELASLVRMDWLAAGCGSLREASLAGCRAPELTSMDAAFQGDGCLARLDLEGFSAPKLESMRRFAAACPLLESLDLSWADEGRAVDMAGAFDGCGSLSSVRFSAYEGALDADSFEGMRSGVENEALLAQLDDVQAVNDACTVLKGAATDEEKVAAVAALTDGQRDRLVAVASENARKAAAAGEDYGFDEVVAAVLAAYEAAEGEGAGTVEPSSEPASEKEDLLAACARAEALLDGVEVGDAADVPWGERCVSRAMADLLARSVSLARSLAEAEDAVATDVASARAMLDLAAAVFDAATTQGTMRIPIDGARVRLSATGKVYDGQPFNPTVKSVRLADGTVLGEGDWSAAYLDADGEPVDAADVCGAGSYRVRVAGEGRYGGSVDVPLEIALAKNPVAVVVSTPVKQFERSVSAQLVAAPGDGYDVVDAAGAVGYRKVGGSACMSVDGVTGAVSIDPGAPVGLYYVRVRVSAAGAEGAYEAGSALADFYALVL